MEENQKVTIQEPNPSNADIMAQMMSEYEAETPVTEPEVETETVTEEPELETVETVEDVATEEPVVEKEAQSSKTNQAFKQMREQMEAYKQTATQNEAYAKVIKEIAEANGITPDQLIQNYQDKKATQEAEKIGIPVEVYNKLNTLESEVKTLRNKPIEDKFNADIDSLVKQYNLQDDELRAFFVEANANGFDLTKVKSISKVYEFLNVDKVINKKEQERLEQKEKIRKQAPLTPTNTAAVEVNEDDEIQKMLEKHGAWNG